MNQKLYFRLNNLFGWLVFSIAACTYLLTVEPSISLWDCPEYVTCAAKGEVGHPPGNTFFLLAGRFLIETQIRQSEPGNAPISLRRQIFLGETPLQRIPIDEDCYYLTCSKGDNCPDSRETGYITADKISGRYVEWPTSIDKAIISPAFHYAHSGFRIISDIFNNVVETASSLFNKIRSFFGD